MRTNLTTYNTSQFQVLSEDQCEGIYHNILEVMQRTGVDVCHEEARQILKEAGAHVDGTRVYIPPYLVKEAISLVPDNFVVHHWDGSGVLRLRRNEVYPGTGPSMPNYIDPFTEERRPFKRKDAADVARVCDALPNILFVEGLGSISDTHRNLADLYEFVELITNTAKPIAAWSFNRDSCENIYKVAVAMAGGEEEFQRKPNFMFYMEPIPPLVSNYESVDKALFCAEKHIPAIYTPCCMGGATEPATFAGLLTNAAAECLTGLVIGQLKRRGAPFIMGGVMTVMDMLTSTYIYGGPELSIMCAGMTDLGKYLNIPVFSTGGCTDAKVTEPQAALEGAISNYTAVLSGANLIHDTGYSESGLTGNLFNVVMNNEILGMAFRIARGIEVNEDTMALEIIDRVGPQGHFLTQEHTNKYFRTEMWEPEMLNRVPFEAWEDAGRKPLGERVKEKTRDIIKNHRTPEVPEAARKEIESILEAAEKKAREDDEKES